MAFIPSTEDQWVFCKKMYKKGDLAVSIADGITSLIGGLF